MKKFAILFSLIAAFAVAGCGSDDKPAAAPTQTPQAAPAKPANTVQEKQQNKETAFDKDMKKIENKYNGGKPDLTKGDSQGIHHFSK